MKKLLFIFITLLLFSCSKSDDSADNTNPNNTTTDTKINLPDWLNGIYKADQVISYLSYPRAFPYSIEFKSKNDMLIKAKSSTSPIESLQSKIDGFVSSGRLISIKESYNTIPNTTNYIIEIRTKSLPPSSGEDIIKFTINKRTGTDANNISIIYSTNTDGETSSRYTPQ